MSAAHQGQRVCPSSACGRQAVTEPTHGSTGPEGWKGSLRICRSPAQSRAVAGAYRQVAREASRRRRFPHPCGQRRAGTDRGRTATAVLSHVEELCTEPHRGEKRFASDLRPRRAAKAAKAAPSADPPAGQRGASERQRSGATGSAGPRPNCRTAEPTSRTEEPNRRTAAQRRAEAEEGSGAAGPHSDTAPRTASRQSGPGGGAEAPGTTRARAAGSGARPERLPRPSPGAAAEAPRSSTAPPRSSAAAAPALTFRQLQLQLRQALAHLGRQRHRVQRAAAPLGRHSAGPPRPPPSTASGGSGRKGSSRPDRTAQPPGPARAAPPSGRQRRAERRHGGKTRRGSARGRDGAAQRSRSGPTARVRPGPSSVSGSPAGWRRSLGRF